MAEGCDIAKVLLLVQASKGQVNIESNGFMTLEFLGGTFENICFFSLGRKRAEK